VARRRRTCPAANQFASAANVQFERELEISRDGKERIRFRVRCFPGASQTGSGAFECWAKYWRARRDSNS
jgi:hypothetical protein